MAPSEEPRSTLVRNLLMAALKLESEKNDQTDRDHDKIIDTLGEFQSTLSTRAVILVETSIRLVELARVIPQTAVLVYPIVLKLCNTAKILREEKGLFEEALENLVTSYEDDDYSEKVAAIQEQIRALEQEPEKLEEEDC